MALDMMSALGYPYSLSATSITCAMAIKSIPIIKPIQWMASSLGVLRLRMHFLCIILGTSNTTSQIVTTLILTAFQPWSTLMFDMTAASSIPWSATTIPPWKRSTRLVLELNVWILLPICFSPERLWTFPSQQPTPTPVALLTMGHIQYY